MESYFFIFTIHFFEFEFLSYVWSNLHKFYEFWKIKFQKMTKSFPFFDIK